MKLKVIRRCANLSVQSVEEANASDAYQNRGTRRIGALELVLEYLPRPRKLLSEARATRAGTRGVRDLGNEAYTLVLHAVQHQAPVPVRIRSDNTGDALFRAITKLKTFPKVDLASPEPLSVGPSAVRP